MLTTKAKKPKPNAKPKGTKYAKGAQAGDWVHIKATHVSNMTQLKRWYGSQADDQLFTGQVEEVVVATENKRKDTYYDCFYYGLPDGLTKFKRNKSLLHYPGKWEDAAPPPRVSVLGSGQQQVVMTNDDDTDNTPSPPTSPLRNDAPPLLTNKDLRAMGVSQSLLLSDYEEESVSSFEDLDPATASVDNTDVEGSQLEETEVMKPAVKTGLDWFSIDEATEDDINGPIAPMKWRFLGVDGSYIEPKDDLRDTKRSPLDYFMATMPASTLHRIVSLTNEKLREKEMDPMCMAELLRFFGICILITRCEFENRRDLWSLSTGCRFLTPMNLGQTGMSRNRFEALWTMVTFSKQEPTLPEGMSSQEYRWQLVDDFVDDYNRHRRSCFRPSKRVSTDTFTSLSNIYSTGVY
jgi:Transposase IS4